MNGVKELWIGVNSSSLPISYTLEDFIFLYIPIFLTTSFFKGLSSLPLRLKNEVVKEIGKEERSVYKGRSVRKIGLLKSSKVYEIGKRDQKKRRHNMSKIE